MSVSRSLAAMVLSAVWVVSCVNDPDMAIHRAPEILNTSIDRDGTIIRLSCEVTKGDNISECGFFIGQSGDDMARFATGLPVDNVFSLEINRDAFPGNICYYRSFVTSGDETRMSLTQSEILDLQPPRLSIESLTAKNEGVIEVVYTVTDDISGELFFRGVCVNTTGAPEFMQSGMYYRDGESGYGSCTLLCSGFDSGVTYYFKALALTCIGVTYSDEAVITMP